ncbi:trehalose-phosphatase [Microbacterium sp. W1N]|uniref:trehalose-phosphatase n=1 Tax=Microbacterium festucae TaxID=2977531 RepID=UPI0021C0E2F6|nr:trehalose-phosphatase [Microbacterium festucae]MCT9820381.1 trehalose-phosphatase [Microbacterium festucae]
MSAGALARVAATEVLLVALDFDGTLAPLVDEPMSARMTAQARAAVTALRAAPDTHVAFVSGRSLADLRVISEYDEASGILLAGSHGAEFHPAAADDQPIDADEVRALSDAATAAVAGLDGVWVETKPFGFAVHTRLASDADGARAHEAIAALVTKRAPRWRRRRGHDLTEYSARAAGKDDAVAHLRALTGATAVVFAGDDVTDEDALASLGADDLGIRVGAGASAASMRVDDIQGLASVLVDLAHERVAARQ